MPIAADTLPLIVTLGFDPVTFARLDTWRKRYFPPERNVVPAHLTLFHQWPGETSDTVAFWASIAETHHRMRLRFLSPRKMGNGVCLPVVCQELLDLRAALKRKIAGRLVVQDRQDFRPHVTLQNKVPPETVSMTLGSLMREYEEWEGTGAELCLWRYCGGPWESVASLQFKEL